VSAAAQARYDGVVHALEHAIAAGCQNLRCNDLVEHLIALEFIVKKTAKGNHYTYSHKSLPAFFGGNFNAGHGKNLPIKPCYVRSVLSTLHEHHARFKPARE
jgi:hypothetical protein